MKFRKKPVVVEAFQLNERGLVAKIGSGMQYQKIRSLHMTSENSIKIQLGAK